MQSLLLYLYSCIFVFLSVCFPLRVSDCLLFFFLTGGDSASKEHNKKTIENNEPTKIEILAFSPERR